MVPDLNGMASLAQGRNYGLVAGAHRTAVQLH